MTKIVIADKYCHKSSSRGNSMSPQERQEVIEQFTHEISNRMKDESASIFKKDWWSGRMLEWCMQNETFKIEMFRFIDVLPYLNSSDEIARHIKEYFLRPGQNFPTALSTVLGMASASGFTAKIAAVAIKKNVSDMGRNFITGENPEDSIKQLKKLRKNGLTFSIDILGEAAVSEEEALSYQSRYLDLIDVISTESKNWETIEALDCDNHGEIPKVNISVKLTSLYSQFDPIDFERSVGIMKERLRPIYQKAVEKKVFLNLDMESYFHKDLTLQVFKELSMEPQFKEYKFFGVVIQAYLKDSERDLDDLIAWVKRRGNRITIRLVKGAYWDYETIHARQEGWRIPVFIEKRFTDAMYERLSSKLLANYILTRPAFGSHNIRSLAFALTEANRLGVPKKGFEVQMLYGMAEPIKGALKSLGYIIRDYAPMGELIPGLAYLVRRLLENTSNESFLRQRFAHGVPLKELILPPIENQVELDRAIARDDLEEKNVSVTTASEPSPFKNEPLTNFIYADARNNFKAALEKVTRSFGTKYPLVINNQDVSTDRWIKSLNPSNPSQVIGEVALSSQFEADNAVNAAIKAFPRWQNVSPRDRAEYLFRAAERMRSERFEFAALEVYEEGKQWREADADICEAIDFLEYYGREMIRLSKPRRVSAAPGEDSVIVYKPRGIVLVIAPWNFPMAILAGMACASIVTGNCVVMKPAEQSSVIAFHLMRIFREIGLPEGVLNYLPGLGEEVGRYLVSHPQINLVAFTGSKSVGLEIVRHAAVTNPEQDSVKKVIAEMGGKNAIIVDGDADLDEAVISVLRSAFGYQGQKCSACSRVIVLSENYHRFLTRLVEGAKSLQISPAENPGSIIGPVIDEEAQKRLLNVIQSGEKDATLIFKADVPSQGYFVSPTIFADVDPKSILAQEEHFGPVLSVIEVKTFDEAMKVANETKYALTGAIYSRSPLNIERARREFNVGNLYINRGCTGALVERMPFGGFKMSGVGSKTGGPDYLLQYLEPRTITENTIRRGFAPESPKD